MKRAISLIASVFFFLSATDAFATPPKRSNYVIFNVKGDCGQEDCIALMKDLLKDESADIVSLDAVSLAPHQRLDYKTIIITFKDYKTAPYGAVMQKIASAGYNVISYVIHDTHTGQDVIIPH